MLLVLAVADPERFPAAAARFGARLIAERRLVSGRGAACVRRAQTLPSADALAGGEALCVLLERHGERHAARYLGEWLRARDG